MWILPRSALLTALCLAPVPAVAQIGTSYVFSSSANVQGAFGAYFRTRVAIYNPNPFPVSVLARLFTPAGGSDVRSLDLSAFGLYTSENFLGDEFGYSGGAGFRLVESTVTHPFVVTAEVYADGPHGRFTTPLTGLVAADRVPREEETGYGRSQALRADASYRANFGCANLDDVETVVRGQFWGRSGTVEVVENVTLTLPPQGWKQLPVPIQADWLRVNFRVASGGGPLGTYCYGVTVNNVSNDGTVTTAQRVTVSD